MTRTSAATLVAIVGLAAGWLAYGPSAPLASQSGSAAAPAASAPTAAPAPTEGDLQRRFAGDVQPVFERFCYDCHADGAHKGGFSFDKYPDLAAMRADRRLWRTVRDHLEFHIMPPADEDQPSHAERQLLLAWVNDALFRADPNHPDPGRVTVRRLNRAEYQNTLRDLLGVQLDLAAQLPEDDSGYGYDNIGDVLTLAPAHLDRYLKAAEAALQHAFDDPRAKPVNLTVTGETMTGDGQPQGSRRLLIMNGRARTEFNLPRDGTYQVKLVAGGDQAGDEPVKLRLYAPGQGSRNLDVPQPRDQPGTFTFDLPLQAGRNAFSVAFLNDFWDQSRTSNNDRNLLIHTISVSGPSEPFDGPPTQAHQRAFPPRPPQLDDAGYARLVIQQFGRRAWRRPLSSEETERFLGLVSLAQQQQDSLENGIRLAMQAMLVSPDFLFRELDAVRNPPPPGQNQLVPELTLASRLSYFLWSSMPDDELLDLAERGQLRANLHAQVERMLKDPRSGALVDRMFAQWLQFSNVLLATPSTQVFPAANKDLRAAMAEETRRFCLNLIQQDRPVTDLIDADYTFADARLARHYGLPAPAEAGFARVSLQQTPRRGILTHGSILTVTSNRTRTSPVLRGKWVLENLLNIEPPPPPPNVASLESARQGGKPAATLREELEAHRADPGCASCHRLMDGIGFSFEHFDGIGAWRNDDNGRPIDPNGTLISGEAFDSPAALAKIIATDKRGEFLNCVATKILTFALGRGLDYYDTPAVQQIITRANQRELRFSAFIHAVTESLPFQYRRTAAGPLDPGN